MKEINPIDKYSQTLHTNTLLQNIRTHPSLLLVPHKKFVINLQYSRNLLIKTETLISIGFTL